MKVVFVRDLKVGVPVESVQLGVVECVKAEDKNGRTYCNLTLQDNSGVIKAKIWSDTLSRLGDLEFKPGLIIEVNGAVQEYRGVAQLTITDLKPLKDDEYILSDFALTTAKEIAALEAEINDYVRKISDKELRDLLTAILKTYRDEYLSCPAAKTNHHHFIGGLAEHVVEMLRLGECMLGLYPEANDSLVYSGIILHDIGKIKELAVKGFAVEYTSEGKLLGHIPLGFELVQDFIKDPKNKLQYLLGSPKLMLLKHIILSHHGSLEYGSPVVPKTIEAIIVSRVDDLSSQTRTYQKILTTAIDEDMSREFSERVWSIDSEVFLQTAMHFGKLPAESLNMEQDAPLATPNATTASIAASNASAEYSPEEDPDQQGLF